MNTASNTCLRLTTQVGQAHVATGPRNQLPTSQTREHSGTQNSSLTDLHRLGRWAPPVRPVPAGETWRLPQNSSTPVKPVKHTGQTGPSQKAPKHQIGLPSSKLTQTRNSSHTGQQWTHPNVHPSKTQQGCAPVRSVWPEFVGMNNARGSTHPTPNPDLLNRSMDLRKTLRIVGTPHGESIAKFMSTKTCQIKSNRRNSTKNSSNPRALKTPKSRPLTYEFGWGIKGKRTTKGSQKHPPPNPQEQGQNTPRKPPREGSENHHQEQTGTTQPSLEEPRWIIYTYQRGSYKV
jgi:hypothetical protein